MQKTTLQYLQERVVAAPEILKTAIGADLVELLRQEDIRSRTDQCRKLVASMFAISPVMRITKPGENQNLVDFLTENLPRYNINIELEAQRAEMGGLASAINHPQYKAISIIYFQRGYLEHEATTLFNSLLSESSLPIFAEWLKYAAPLELSADKSCPLSRLVEKTHTSSLSVAALDLFPEISKWPDSLTEAVANRLLGFYKNAASNLRTEEFLEKYSSIIERVVKSSTFTEQAGLFQDSSLANRFLEVAVSGFDVEGLKRFGYSGWAPTTGAARLYSGMHELNDLYAGEKSALAKSVLGIPKQAVEQRILETLDYLQSTYNFNFSKEYLAQHGVPLDKQRNMSDAQPIYPACEISLSIVSKLVDMGGAGDDSYRSLLLDVCMAKAGIKEKENLILKILALNPVNVHSLPLAAVYSGLPGATTNFLRKLLPTSSAKGVENSDSLAVQAALSDNKSIVELLYPQVTPAFPVMLGVALGPKWGGSTTLFPTLPILEQYPNLLPGMLGGLAVYAVGNCQGADIQKRLLNVLALKEAGADLNAGVQHSLLLHRLGNVPNKVFLPFLRQAGFTKETLDVQNKAGETIAHNAALRGGVLLLDKLKGMGADLEIRDNKGKTPFLVACSNHSTLAILALQRLGADISVVDNDGRGGVANFMDRSESPSPEAICCLEQLLNSGVSVASPTPLLGSFISSYTPKILTLLLEKGVDPNAEIGGCLVMRTASCGFDRKLFLEICAEHGGNIFKSDSVGCPLNELSAEASMDLVTNIIEKQLAGLQLTTETPVLDSMELW